MKWTDRTFAFEFPAHIYPELIEQLRRAPDRARALTDGLAQDALTRRQDNAWSIQEHIGHLADLDEQTFLPRFKQYDAQAEELKPADMANAATEDAHHNEQSLQTVLRRFEHTRAAIAAHVADKPPEYFARTAHHARLGRPMRAVDTLQFMTEHDRHHFGRIQMLRDGL